MNFGKTYKNYVETEARRLLPNCPNIEFERLKKLLKSCSQHSVSSLATVPSVSSALENVAITTRTEKLEGSIGSPSSCAGSDCAHEEPTPSVQDEDVPPESSCPGCDAEFFPDLDKAVSAVVECFNSRAKDLLRAHLTSGIYKYLARLRIKIAGNRGSILEVGDTLLSYGCMNALAVRKILKAYDKVHHSENGQAFKSRLNLKRVELLQSPLLLELNALAINLLDERAPHAGALPQKLGYISCSFDEPKHTISCVIPDGMQLDFDLTCSICLEIVFDPVALGCGHLFCTSCACSAARVSIFLGLKCARHSSKCPLCRQTGVYPKAVKMRELHRLIRKRCTTYYLERLPAERQGRLRAAKAYYDMETQSYLRM